MLGTERKYLVKAEEIAGKRAGFSHPWNPNSEILGTRLSTLAGLSRVGVSLAHIPHHREEEWIYIISGRGIAEIDGEEFEVAAGDFIGFPTPSVAHHLRNPYGEELVYLMGGENVEVEVADFPRLRKRMLRLGQNVEIYGSSDAVSFGPLE